MSKHSLKITREHNGYILNGFDSETGEPITFVIEDDKSDDLKSHENLLQQVMDYFCFGGNKHDKERIWVRREKHD